MTEYIIINKTAIQQRIDQIQKSFKISKDNEDEIRAGIEHFELEQLKWVLSQSTPLIPQIEKALYAKGAWFEDEVQDYISNLKLDI
jgi:hypothetical protein